MKILLVSDDLESADILAYGLRRAGFSIVMVGYTDKAAERCKTEDPDIVLIEQNSAELSYAEICREICATTSAPAILIGSHPTEDEVVNALQLGIDDYIAKPVSPRYLSARIKALARRIQRESQSQNDAEELPVGNMTIRLDSRYVMKGGQQIPLTPIEFRIFHRLAKSQGQVVPINKLVWDTWGSGKNDVSGVRLRTHISRLRKKLQLSPLDRGYIRAVSGLGYKLQT